MRTIIFKVLSKIKHRYHTELIKYEKTKLGYCGERVKIEWPNHLSEKIFLYDDVYIYGGAKILISPGGKFIMKHHAGASQGLTVITGKHKEKIGSWFHDTMWSGELDVESTVTVEEDARLGANVTLLSNVTIGRGAQIGAGAIVTKSIPPYAIAAGIPAKVIKFILTPEQLIEHELNLYSKEERYTLKELETIQAAYK